MDKEYCIYKHITPSGKVYVGITCQEPERRWDNGNGYKANPHLRNAIRKYGWENISHEILKTGLTKEEAMEGEVFYISLYKSMDPQFGYNHTTGGEAGYHLSENVKAALSEKSAELWRNAFWRENQMKVRNDPYWKAAQSIRSKKNWKKQDVRDRIITGIKNKWSDPDFRERMGHANSSEERRRKISNASKRMWAENGRKEQQSKRMYDLWQQDGYRERVQSAMIEKWKDDEFRRSHSGANSPQSRAINQYDKNGMLIASYLCISDAGAALGKNTGHIVACAKGRRSTAYGYVWKCADTITEVS